MTRHKTLILKPLTLRHGTQFTMGHINLGQPLLSRRGLYRAGRTNTLNKTRALLMMDTGEVQSFLLMALVLCDQIFAQGLCCNCRVQILHLGDL